MIPKDKRDIDPQETQEWIDSLEDELEEQGAVGPGDAGKAREVLIDGF